MDAVRFERGLDVIKDGKPGKESEALKDDADVGGGIADGLAVPEDLAGRGLGETGKHAQQSAFAGAGGSEQGKDLAGFDGEVGGSDDGDGSRVVLSVELFNFQSLDDGFRHCLPLPRAQECRARRDMHAAILLKDIRGA